MFAAAKRLITASHTHRPAEQAPDDQDLPPASPRSHSAWVAMLGFFAAAGAWVLLTEFGEGFAAQVCYRHGMAPGAPQWLMPILGAATVGALLIGLIGVAAAWRHWRLVRDTLLDTVGPRHDRSMGRRRYVAMAALLLNLLFLLGLAAAGLAVLLVSPCSAWR